MRLILLIFLIVCSDGFRIRIHKRSNKLLLFETHFDNEMINGISVILMTMPHLIKAKNGNCDRDEDCSSIQRCCKIGYKKYCCDPNNFIYLDYAFNKEYISPNNINISNIY